MYEYICVYFLQSVKYAIGFSQQFLFYLNVYVDCLFFGNCKIIGSEFMSSKCSFYH